jgi:signal transduction histidine kinase/CheY-like chemotaxis protein
MGDVDVVNMPIAMIFDQLSSISDNMSRKLFKNRKLNICSKKKISGDMLHSSLSDANVEMIFETIINSVIHQNIIYHVFLLRDVSEKINIDENIQKKQNNFIAFLSHELRNPLQSIILSNFLLQKEFTQQYESKKLTNNSQQHDNNIKIKTYLATMEKSCSDMRKIIGDILDLSKIEAREMSIDIDICNIKDFIQQLISMHSKKLNISCIYHNEIPELLYTDEVRLDQILSNLLMNAIKYTDDEYSKKIIQMDVSFDKQNSNIQFSVTDNGIGIRTEELGQLFKEFGKSSNNLNNNYNSNGLGLCISQKMAHLLGGYISVKSEYKKGSTFTLHHPINLQNKKIENENIDWKKSYVKGNILLVDDNESNLSLLQMLMEHFNCELNYDLEIHAVNSGYDAIKICQINKYDIIFMDINMIGMDGCTACKMIKQDGFDKYIIATTGNILAKQEYNQQQNKKYCCFDDIIIKPYDNTIILKTIQKFLKK